MTPWRKIGTLILVFSTIGVLLISFYLVIKTTPTVVPQKIPKQVKRIVPPTLPKKIGIIRHLKILDPVVNGFKVGMEELGYVNGKNIVYDIQLAQEDNPDKLLQIVQDYVEQDVDLIYAAEGVAARAALDETQRTGKTYIPIIFAYANNPVETALVQSFQHPGNNATGVAVDLESVTEKKLEFLRLINPDIKKIGFFVTESLTPPEKLILTELRLQAANFEVEIVEYPIHGSPSPSQTAELSKIAQNIKQGEIDAYYHIPVSTLNKIENLTITGEMGRRLKIPSIYTSEEDLQVSQGLLSYGHDLFAVGKQAAEIVAIIIEGNHHPEDMPVQSPKKNILVINLRAANENGISIPQELLDIADKVLK